MAGVTSKLARFVADVRFGDLPGFVIERSKEVLLDSIGCALGGYVTERGKIAIELGEAFGTRPEASIIGHRKASCPAASFVNGELINCLDFDATGPIGGHIVPYVIPSALAISEKVQATGKDLITAVAVALEVGGRATGSVAQANMLKEEPPYYEESPRYSYNSTVFGAVAGACRLLGMDESSTRSAFGIAGASTPVAGARKWLHLAEGNNFNLKYGTWSGWVAMLGTMAALAAQKGFKGDPNIFDGEYGYWQMYGSPFFKDEKLIGDLGRVWYAEEVRFKYYPACHFDAAPVTAVERLVRDNQIRPEDIDEIIIYGDPMMQTPQRFPPSIATNEDAQFSHAYLAAMAACYEGTPGPQWQLPSSLTDPRVLNLASKVKIKLHPRTEELKTAHIKAGGFPAFFDVIGEITAKGKKYEIEVNTSKGLPSSPMSRTELVDKFRQNAQFSLLKQDKVELAMEALWRLEKLDCVAGLTGLLSLQD